MGGHILGRVEPLHLTEKYFEPDGAKTCPFEEHPSNNPISGRKSSSSLETSFFYFTCLTTSGVNLNTQNTPSSSINQTTTPLNFLTFPLHNGSIFNQFFDVMNRLVLIRNYRNRQRHKCDFLLHTLAIFAYDIIL